MDYYTYSGHGNNLWNPTWGVSGGNFLRVQMTAADNYNNNGMNYAQALPGAREISSSLKLPAYKSRKRDAHSFTDTLTFIGQFIKHDICQTKEGTETAPIIVPLCDFYFDRDSCGLGPTAAAAATPETIQFYRSAYKLDNDGKRQQINDATAYIDGSGIYGHDAGTVDKLRSYVHGKMLMYNDQLPLNIMHLMMADPVGKETPIGLRAAGDPRANIHPMSLALHTLFLREHNRKAEEIFEENPHLTDEVIFYRAKKWVVALLQKICFYEYLPAIGINLPTYASYDATINPGIDTFFATAAFRFGHGQILDIILRVDAEGREITDGHLLLHHSFYRPTASLSDGIEPILRGATIAGQAKTTPIFSNALRNYLYGPSKHGGRDLMALNIQRGRDHGLPFYNDARTQLRLQPMKSFRDMTSDHLLAKQLETIYGSVDNVDAYIGGLAEDPHGNSSLGELFVASLTDQFTRLRDGDRFYFENKANGLFNEEELETIKQTSLRDLILRNTDISVLPDNIYVRNRTQPWPTSTPVHTADTIEITPALDGAVEELVPSVYTIQWQRETVNSEEYLRITIVCATTGWVGFGLAKDASSAMVNADIIIASVRGGVATLDDYWSTTFAQPVPDSSLGGSKDVELISGSEVDGITTIVFRRKITATDSYDRSIGTTEAVPIIYAWHSTSDVLQYHTPLRRGSTLLDFYGRLESESAPVATDVAGETPFGGIIQVDQSMNLHLEWAIVEKAGYKYLNATIKMTTRGLSFVVLGIEGDERGLNHSDVIKIESSGRYCSILDAWAVNKDNIVPDYFMDGNDDLEYTNCSTDSQGHLEATFLRVLDTEDPADQPIMENGYTNIFLLWDSEDLMVNSSRFESKRLEVDFFALEGTSSAWHEISDFASETKTGQSGDSAEPTTKSTDSAESSQRLEFENHVVLDQGAGYHLYYTANDEIITIHLSLHGNGFAAIGIPGEERNMRMADIIIASSTSDGRCEVGDYWSTSFVKPVLDSELGGIDDLNDVFCTIQDGYLNATFTRSLASSDANDRSVNPDESLLTFIYAFHPSSDGLAYHGATRRGAVDVDIVFITTESQAPITSDGPMTDEEELGADNGELLSIEFDDSQMKELAEGYKIWWLIQDSDTSNRRRFARKLMSGGELEDDAIIVFKLQRESTGWMGLGIEPADISVNGMQETDMYITWIDPDGTVQLMDAWSIGFMPPGSDADQGGNNDILEYAGEEKDGITTVIFKRKINTGDDFDRVITDTAQGVVFAYGDDDGLPPAGHGPCCRGKESINWKAGGEDSSSGGASPNLPNEKLKTAHAWMMIFGWAMFSLTGLLICNMGRHWKYWKLLHIGLEVLAVIFSTIGEICALAYTNGEIRGAHGILAFFISCTMIPQLFLGYYSEKKQSPYWQKLHRGLGYFIVGVACWQMWLGMRILEMDIRLVECYYAWLISTGVALHFGADSVSLFEIKAQLVNKGFEIDESTVNKGAKSVLESSKDKKEPETEIQTKKQKNREKKTSESTPTSAPRNSLKDEAQQKAEGENSDQLMEIDMNLFMESCANGQQWTIIDHQVYDMADIIDIHPGGPDQVIDILGKDASDVYHAQHSTSQAAHRHSYLNAYNYL